MGLHTAKTQLLPVFRLWLAQIPLPHTAVISTPCSWGKKLLGLDSNHKGINCLLAAKNSARQRESHISAPIALPGFFVNCAGGLCTALWWSKHNETLCWGAGTSHTSLQKLNQARQI